MGIYIKGMEMPETCKLCPLSELDARNYMIVCRASGYLIDVELAKTKRPTMICPLIEVPEPHGRLIDADKLRKAEFIHDGDAYAVVMSRVIEQAPTIIPAEKGE